MSLLPLTCVSMLASSLFPPKFLSLLPVQNYHIFMSVAHEWHVLVCEIRQL